jgi:hypothetical protein
MGKTAREIIKEAEYLKGERALWETYWQGVGKYCIPFKSYITRSRTSGRKLDADIYDSTGISSSQFFAAGLQSYLTNPSQRWFSLGLQDKILMEDKAIKEWLKIVEDKIFDTLNSSNFYSQNLDSYLDLGVFGTGTMYEEEDEKDIVRFSSRPVEEILFIVDVKGRVIAVYRIYKLTAKQASDQWGNNAGDNVLTSIKAGKFEEKYDFIHLVEERGKRDVSKKDKLNKPMSSTFVNVSQGKKVSEGGYDEFPFFVARFYQASGEKHGYSPAMIAYPDILMVNEMSKIDIMGGQLSVAPPLQVPSDGFILPISTKPRGITYKNPGADPRAEIKPLFTGSDVRLGLEMEDRRRDIIERAFFVDLFLALSQAKGKMTATEVVERAGEKMALLGSAIGRVMKDHLEPVITRTFSILAKGGHIPPTPEAVRDKDFNIEYISVLARAQKLAESKGLDRFLERVGAVAGVVPAAIDKVDTDKVVDEIAKIEGVTPVIVRDEKGVKAIRAARAAEQQQAAQLENLQAAANVVKTGSDIAKNAEVEK